MFTISILFLTLSCVQCFTSYGNVVPNALNVIVDGVRAVGLGHGSLTARSTNSRAANPFGLDMLNIARTVNARDIWPILCDLDSDGDGFPNKDELCDPECVNIGGEPECTGNLTLTHPGFFNIVDEDGNDEGVDIPVNQELEVDEMFYKAHGWLMIFAWVILAPLGIAMPLIFKKGPSPFWFKYHKVLLMSCVVITFLAFALLLGRVRVEPIEFAIEEPGLDFSKHVLIGLTVVIISVIQPISGYFRPHLNKDGEEKSSFRMFWEFQHRWTGRLGLVLAFVAIDYGILLVYPDAEAAGIVLILLLVVAGVISFLFVFFGFRDSMAPSEGREEDKAPVANTNKALKAAKVIEADEEVEEKVAVTEKKKTDEIIEEVVVVDEDADLIERL